MLQKGENDNPALSSIPRYIMKIPQEEKGETMENK
jgi:hypothetical protein